jgi:DNA-directed RNA polymerase
MIVPPRDWTTPLNGGYLTYALATVAVKRAYPNYIKDMHDCSMSTVYAAMNSLQRTAWTVNNDLYNVLSQAWGSGIQIGGLPSRGKTHVLPELPNPEGKQKGDKAWRAAAAKAYRESERLRNARRDVEGNLNVAERMLLRDRFYFVYTMDRRGRLYAASDYLNPQGTDIAKALLRFAEGVPFGEHGVRWLAIHGANRYGHNKVSFDERVAWVRANEQNIMASAADPLSNRFWAMQETDKPWQFLAFCKEWVALRAWVAAGHAARDFASHLPVSVDGTCNGLQHLTMLMRDQDGAVATNLTPSDKPQDIYQRVADEANRLLGTKKVTRKMAKRPTMTLPYGSTHNGVTKQLKEVIEAELPEENSFELAKALTPVVRKAIGNVVMKAPHAMAWLQEVVRVYSRAELALWWTTPSGFPVVHRYMKTKGKSLDHIIAGTRHQLTLEIEDTELDKRKQLNAIVANYIHSLDAAHLVYTIDFAVQKGIKAFSAVHDSYGTHAGKMEVLAEELRRAFVVMYKRRDAQLGYLPAEARSDLAEDAPGPIPDVPEMGSLDPEVVMDSKYFFS